MNESEQLNLQLALQESFAKARSSQDMLDDVPASALPEDYRNNVVLRMDRNNFYVAFSDEPDNLQPTDDGFMPNAHIKSMPATTMPNRLGGNIKDWIDQIRDTEKRNK